MTFLFQDAVSPVMTGLVELHDYIMFYLLFILSLVAGLILSILAGFSAHLTMQKLINLVFFFFKINIFI